MPTFYMCKAFEFKHYFLTTGNGLYTLWGSVAEISVVGTPYIMLAQEVYNFHIVSNVLF